MHEIFQAYIDSRLLASAPHPNLDPLLLHMTTAEALMIASSISMAAATRAPRIMAMDWLGGEFNTSSEVFSLKL